MLSPKRCLARWPCPLWLKADIAMQVKFVRFVPIADITPKKKGCVLILVVDCLTQSSPARAPCRWASFEASVKNCAKVIEVRLSSFLGKLLATSWGGVCRLVIRHDVVGAQRGDNNLPALDLDAKHGNGRRPLGLVTLDIELMG